MQINNLIPILIAIGTVIVFRILSSIIANIAIRIFRTKSKEKREVKKNPFYQPIKTVVTYIGISIGFNILKENIDIPIEIITIITKIIKISLIIFVAKAFVNGLDEKNDILSKIKTKKGNEIDSSTKSILARIIKTIIYVFAVFFIISELGYDIGGIMAGLGLGGVVITLAAQDTAKSLIGGIAIFFDKPFKVGDYIKIGENEGTVEDIKFRSTSIRTIENSVLHIPNSEVAIASIINYTEMKKRRYSTKLTLELDTPLEKVENLKVELEKRLLNIKQVIKNSIIINLNEISTNGMDIMIIAYINETKYVEFIKIKEEINYNIIQELRNENIELAYNTQTIHVKNSK